MEPDTQQSQQDTCPQCENDYECPEGYTEAICPECLEGLKNDAHG